MQVTFPKRNKELQQTSHQKSYTEEGNRIKYLLYWEGRELCQLFFKNKTDGNLDYEKRENLNKYIECAKGDSVTETTEI